MKIVVITGATRGLGLEVTRQALKSEYKVIAIGRAKSEALEQLQDQYPEHLIFEAYDFNDLSGIHKLATSISKNHGRPWGLVNNAAIGYDGVLATLHEKDISQLIRVNIEAPILLTKYLLRPMLINQQGRIINISSIIASTGFNGLSVYAATKSALTGFTKSLSREVGKVGITVNTISPGYMETDMTNELQREKKQSILRRSPLGRLASTEDVASSIMYLLSEKSSSITGTNITIDAGSTA
ncbi:3-oxoacyl-ACP reductase [Nitrincola sp. A-D6]|uniref:SDR family NAD(P)-dependent oxidoreductase n=1 Tax=Nitrincola sp. A-D6 TaxID=1545442 RepID=UPI00051FEE70|nr:SDR family NAD(P)-dependent oxidoreductase [Nitrincola sp. A-D6]KGK41842.1 3-oxoacyl-ACP reductase [Nitrincola sp. A-D6]